MRLLANENFPKPAVEALRAAQHDTAWIHADAPGITAQEVMAHDRAETRPLLTFDKDLCELVFRLGEKASHGIVLFRIPLPNPAEVARVVVSVLSSRTDWEKHFAVVERGRVRLRALPKSG